jgi:hypothetical protein
MCSILYKPIPSAQNFFACSVSLGVSAFVLAFNLLYLSAIFINSAKFSPEISGSATSNWPSNI